MWRCVTIVLALICAIQMVLVLQSPMPESAATAWSTSSVVGSVRLQHTQQQRQQQQPSKHHATMPTGFVAPAAYHNNNNNDHNNSAATVASRLVHLLPNAAWMRSGDEDTHAGEQQHAEQPVSVSTVFVASLVSAVMSGLGGAPFLCISNVSRWALGLCNASAAGLMLAACVSLTIEGYAYSAVTMLSGVVSGIVFIVASTRLLEQYESLRFGELKGMSARKVLLVMSVMTLHSLAEGVGMGMSFGGGRTLGMFINIAIAIHNIPEGIAVALVMVPRGVSPVHAMLWGAFSSLPQPLMAVPAFLFVEVFTPILPWGLGFAAGAMVWMVFTELIPDALEETESRTAVVVALLAALSVMCVFQFVVLEAWLAVE